MDGRRLGIAAVGVVLLAAVAWWALDRRAVDAPVEAGPMLPGLATRQAAIDRITLRAAGGVTVVELERIDGEWRVPARTGWPANQRRIGDALQLLADTRRLEAKTAVPARWARLGVEDVADGDAKGAELVLAGGGEPLRVTIGGNHPALGGSYVRVGDDPQAWLVDSDIEPAREPAVWLDRRLLDIPVARIEGVRIAAAGARPFVLTRRDDAFALDALPPAALHRPDAGVATAGFTDQLALDDVAADDGSAEATHEAVFTTVDGLLVTVESWRDGDATWARLRATLDVERATAWAASSAGDADEDAATRIAALRAQVDAWEARWRGRRFLLPAYKAELLARTREEYLAGPALRR